jgi:hypothetical protein
MSLNILTSVIGKREVLSSVIMVSSRNQYDHSFIVVPKTTALLLRKCLRDAKLNKLHKLIFRSELAEYL